MPSAAFHVLVVDDSPTQQLQIRMVLENGGFQVSCAANGLLALAAIEAAMPDIVVTDLQMPEMDGLELVSEIKVRYPSLPVILTTAVGSEAIAAKALHLGAASYVPKRELAEYLCDTLQQVMSVAYPESQQPLPPQCIRRVEVHLEIANDESLVPAVIGRLEQALKEVRFCGEMQWLQLAMALDEAILNAIFHGNLEVSSDLRQADDGETFFSLVQQRKGQSPYCDRRVGVSLELTADRAAFTVQDGGDGFDTDNLPDPTDPANLERAGGRGLLLIHSFMDEVSFSARGNQIVMVKHKAATVEEAAEEISDGDQPQAD